MSGWRGFLCGMTEWVDDYERSILALINTHGVAIQGVGGDEGSPSFAYTVGLAAHEHAEFIIMGLPMGVAQALLNDLSSHVFTGQKFEAGDVIHELVRGFPVRLVSVADSRELMTMSNRIYGDGENPLDALQVAFPDAEGVWPWEPGSRVANVPLLGPAPADESGRNVRLKD